jgi:hypothetical protein
VVRNALAKKIVMFTVIDVVRIWAGLVTVIPLQAEWFVRMGFTHPVIVPDMPLWTYSTFKAAVSGRVAF